MSQNIKLSKCPNHVLLMFVGPIFDIHIGPRPNYFIKYIKNDEYVL